jgi:hypothetical protein
MSALLDQRVFDLHGALLNLPVRTLFNLWRNSHLFFAENFLFVLDTLAVLII